MRRLLLPSLALAAMAIIGLASPKSAYANTYTCSSVNGGILPPINDANTVSITATAGTPSCTVTGSVISTGGDVQVSFPSPTTTFTAQGAVQASGNVIITAATITLDSSTTAQAGTVSLEGNTLSPGSITATGQVFLSATEPITLSTAVNTQGLLNVEAGSSFSLTSSSIQD
jgi:hypothetical protein